MQDVHAVQVRKAEVQNHNTRLELDGSSNTFFAGSRFLDSIAATFEASSDEPAHLHLIINDEHRSIRRGVHKLKAHLTPVPGKRQSHVTPGKREAKRRSPSGP